MPGVGPKAAEYWMNNLGGLVPVSSKDSADREPVPVTMKTMLLPLAQPGRLTSSFAMALRSGVL